MRDTELLASLAAAITVMAAVAIVAPPRRRLTTRLRPYAALSRSRLGTGYADLSVVGLTVDDDRSVVSRVFAPIVDVLADLLDRVLDTSDAVALGRRLRQAGFDEVTVEQYRMRQLASAVVGVALGATLGVVVVDSVPMTGLLLVCFGLPGATWQRGRVERSIEDRRARMRTEAYTVAQLIAVNVRSGHGPVDAVRAVCALGRGPVIVELREALGWIAGGTSPERAYDKLAEATAEPAAARVYRLLSASARTGGDIGTALLAVADDVRAGRRDELARFAARRRTAMVLPLLLCIAPVMVLFVGAALPSLVLGR